jgi:hypothetical protein
VVDYSERASFFRSARPASPDRPQIISKAPQTYPVKYGVAVRHGPAIELKIASLTTMTSTAGAKSRTRGRFRCSQWVLCGPHAARADW